MKSTKHILVFKYAVYALLILLLYVLQATPGLLAIAGVKPLLVVPVAVSVAIFEGEFTGGVYGALAGLLCDLSSFSLFGYNGFFICLFCIAAGLLVIYLMRGNLLGCLLFVAAALLARGSVEYLFSHGMWGHESVWRIYLAYTLPTIIYTLVCTPPLFWLVRKIYLRFEQTLRA